MKPFTRQRASAILAAPGASAFTRHLPRWPGVLVLTYHRVGDSSSEPWDRAVWSADAELFDAQVAAVAASAEIVSVADLQSLADARRRGRMVLITFDDGYRDNHEIAFPILQAHGATAAFFVSTGVLDRPRVPWWDEIAWMVRKSGRSKIKDPTDRIGQLATGPEHDDATIAALIAHYKTLPADRTEGYLDDVAEATESSRCTEQLARQLWMTWDMVRSLRDGGMAIGGHTDSHPILARLPVSAQQREIDICATRMSNELGTAMRWFAYPVGSRDSFTTATQRVLREKGVELAFSFYGGFASFDDWNPLDVRRTYVSTATTPEMLRATLLLPQLFARA
jgi:peptidoglycan/xylan/chitin deacetylase (PgdA/CDA1 family)